MDSAFDNLPIIPHEHVADVDCCGCLMVRVREGQAEILCNECLAVVRTVGVADVMTIAAAWLITRSGHRR